MAELIPFNRKLPKKDKEQLAATARTWIASGFHSRNGLAEDLVAYHDDIHAPEEVLLAAAEKVIETEWARAQAERDAKTGRSDYDRLVAAFDRLAADGFVCRMNFTCCQTCGTAEIDDERTLLPGMPHPGPEGANADVGYPWAEWAYTFFHAQDAEGIIETGVVYLTFSSWRPSGAVGADLIARALTGNTDALLEARRVSETDVGQRVYDALVIEGLEVDWNGDLRQRICVKVPDWRKPLPD